MQGRITMPKWLRALDRTSLIFWKDKNPLTWGHAIALFLSTSVFFTLARWPFSGGETLIDLQSLVVVFEIVIAFVLVLTSGHLGPIEIWAPNLIRLLIVHLILVMVFLSANNLEPRWANLMPSKYYIAAVPTLISTLMLAWYSVRRNLQGWQLLRDWSFYGSICLIIIVTGLITYYSVIP